MMTCVDPAAEMWREANEHAETARRLAEEARAHADRSVAGLKALFAKAATSFREGSAERYNYRDPARQSARYATRAAIAAKQAEAAADAAEEAVSNGWGGAWPEGISRPASYALAATAEALDEAKRAANTAEASAGWFDHLD